MDYKEFIDKKKIVIKNSGFEIDREELNPILFDFQKDIVKWALRKGRAAIFAMTGLGKTFCQVEWGYQVNKKTGGKVLILAPLAVSHQTIREAKKLDIDIHYFKEDMKLHEGLNIANYEILHKINTSEVTGIILDESSILKSYTGTVRNQIIDEFKRTPYKLACTATPAPNDHVELGNHADFLNVMSGWEMLALFFINDGDKANKWRLKGHAEGEFWKWVAEWAVMITKPSDLGYENGGFDLPPLNIQEIIVKSEATEGFLIPMEAQTLQERQRARRKSLEDRCQKAAAIANKIEGPFLTWCDLNDESKRLTELINGAVEIKGADSPEHKEKSMLGFTDGIIDKLVTKPVLAGFGMNWQHCNNMAFVGLSDSFEQIFQAIKRCHRFGQTKPVNVYLIISETEGAVLQNYKRKEQAFEEMMEGMIKYTKDITTKNIRSTEVGIEENQITTRAILPDWLKGAM